MLLGIIAASRVVVGEPSEDSDSHFASVRFLFDMEGAEDSSDFIDRSSHNQLTYPQYLARVNSSSSKYGLTGADFTGGANDGFVTLDEVSLDTTPTFTLEFWLKPQTTTGDTYYIGKTSGGSGFLYIFNSNGFLKCQVRGSELLSVPIVAGQWYHVAVVGRENEDVSWYVDGTLAGSKTESTYTQGSCRWEVGTAPSIAGTSSGGRSCFDDLRLTNGVARYTSDFIPPNNSLPIQ